MACVAIIKQMRPRIPILKHRKGAPSIPSRNVPGIRHRTRESAASNAQKEMTPNHNAHVDRALEIKRQLVNHLQRLRIPLRQCPFMGDVPPSFLA